MRGSDSLPPMPVRTPVDPRTLQALSTRTLRVRKTVQGLRGGIHRSPHLGPSVEFAEHKKYAPGDDIRHIDWRALARTDRHYVKQHQREVILRGLMALDCSASMAYRGSRAHADKIGYAVEIVAALAHVLVRQGDAAGLIAFDDALRDFVPPERRPDHLPFLMARLAAIRCGENDGTAFPEAIARAADIAGMPSLVVLVSDLWGAGRETEVALSRLAARGHDVAVFHVLDPDEVDLPFEQPAVFRGMEGEREVDVDPAFVREDYREAVQAVWDRWRFFCGETGIDLVSGVTSTPPAAVISDFIARRSEEGKGR